jgi:hypothetical protein
LGYDLLGSSNERQWITNERAFVQLYFSGGDAEYPLDEALLFNNITFRQPAQMGADGTDKLRRAMKSVDQFHGGASNCPFRFQPPEERWWNASGDFLLAKVTAAAPPVTSPVPPSVPKLPNSAITIVGGVHKPGETKTNPKDGLKYDWIPPGSFMMGCSPGDSDPSR